MPTKSFYNNYYDVIKTIEYCLNNRFSLPALILIYTLAYSFSWIVYGGHIKNSRKSFEKWVEEWVFPKKHLCCSATDLYAARCAILHTLTSEVDLTKSGEANRVAYAWGAGNSNKLAAYFKQTGIKNIAAIQLEDLFQAIREAMADVIDAADQDENIRERLETAASKHLANIDSNQF